MRSRLAVSVWVYILALTACESSPTQPTQGLSAAEDGVAAAAPAPTQAPADAISANIQSQHLVTEFPFPTIVDPRFGSADPASPAYSTVVGYARAGDAAIWTGHYLAAEAFRYSVTRSPDALHNAKRALKGIQGLVDVTAPETPGVEPWRQPGLLARFLWPDGWWYSDQMAQQEGGHGVYRGAPGGVPHRYLANTTRDQYAGVFFGLATAYDLVEEPVVRSEVRRLVTTMLRFLINNGWNVPMPDGSRYSTTFLQRPEQQLALLQIGRHVNPAEFELEYVAFRTTHSPTVSLPLVADCQDTHSSYFKFNLDHITLYSLIRLEEPGVARTSYLNAFATLRGCTSRHKNAHFNMIERGINGPDVSRDDATKQYLRRWLTRPRRDYYVDLRGRYRACGTDRACRVIPVDERVNTDFLWQRSPFLLYPDHPADGTIETAAIDYVLPYWMGRYYGVLAR